jgi:hypothetical protein
MEGRLTDTLAIPPTLLAGINEASSAEHRPAGDVLRDVLERGREDRRWERLLVYGAAQSSHLGLTEADVPRLIAEARQEQAGA